MSALFQQLPQENQGLQRQLVGRDVTLAQINQQLNVFGIQPSDTIFCYYAGAATYTAAAVQQFLPRVAPPLVAPPPLPRAALLGALNRGNRLRILVSDANSGANGAPPNTLQVVQPADPIDLGTPGVSGTNNLLVHLLLGYSGVVDVNGASPGENAWYSAGGGWFTSRFTKVATTPQADPANFPWGPFLDQVKDDTNTFYQAQRTELLKTPAGIPNIGFVRAQPNQTVQVAPLAITQSSQCVPLSYRPIPLTPDAINAMHSDAPLPTLVCANGKALPDAPPPVIVVERNSPQRLALSPLDSSPVFVSANKGESSARLPVIVNVRNAAIATPKEVSWRPGIETETLAQK